MMYVFHASALRANIFTFILIYLDKQYPNGTRNQFKTERSIVDIFMI